MLTNDPFVSSLEVVVGLPIGALLALMIIYRHQLKDFAKLGMHWLRQQLPARKRPREVEIFYYRKIKINRA